MPEDLARFRAMVPEKKRSKPMTDAQAFRELLELANIFEAEAMRHTRASDQYQAAIWLEKAANLKEILHPAKGGGLEAVETLTEEQARDLEEALKLAEDRNQERKRRVGADKAAFNNLSKEWDRITRLREYLDNRFPPEAA